MRSHHDNIKNEIAYFHKVIKNMDLKDNIKSSKINEYEIPIEEIMYNTFSNGFDVDKQLFEKNLHKAVKSLSIEDQIFISYIVKECKTQQELASKYGINQSSVKNRFGKILRILKNLMSKK